MKFVRFLGVLLLVALAGAGVCFYFLSRPFAGFQKEVLVDIPKGESTQDMADLLAKSGVVEHPWQFLLARVLQPSRKLQAGEYRFAGPASALTVFERIARGDVFNYELTIPEGQNIFEIAAIVESAGLMQAAEFLRAAKDPSLIRDLSPNAPTLEGYLFPDTYRVSRHAGAKDLCRLFTHRFREAWRQLNGSGDVNRTVILASLVEKEAAVPQDRPLIASVFHNRLNMGMKLDCDPTTVYAAILEGRYRGKIYQSDLASRSLYNTYRHPGLPPGPIANPGRDSLRAALHPADTRYVYFVARPDGSGRHAFSRTIAEHAQAAAAYHRGAK